MRLSVALLRDVDAERRAKERAEAPTVKTEEQMKRDEAKEKQGSSSSSSSGAGAQQPAAKAKPSSSSSSSSGGRKGNTLQNVWRRKFRPLPEAKAVDLFADVIGDAFILTVAGGLIVYEYWKALQKPDANKERIDELNRRLEELREREETLAGAEETQRRRFEALEDELRELKDPKTKKPLLPSLQPSLQVA